MGGGLWEAGVGQRSVGELAGTLSDAGTRKKSRTRHPREGAGVCPGAQSVEVLGIDRSRETGARAHLQRLDSGGKDSLGELAAPATSCVAAVPVINTWQKRSWLRERRSPSSAQERRGQGRHNRRSLSVEDSA